MLRKKLLSPGLPFSLPRLPHVSSPYPRPSPILSIPFPLSLLLFHLCVSHQMLSLIQSSVIKPSKWRRQCCVSGDNHWALPTARVEAWCFWLQGLPSKQSGFSGYIQSRREGVNLWAVAMHDACPVQDTSLRWEDCPGPLGTLCYFCVDNWECDPTVLKCSEHEIWAC